MKGGRVRVLLLWWLAMVLGCNGGAESDGLTGLRSPGPPDRDGGRAGPPDPWESRRLRMVKEDIETRGVRDPRVLEAMRTVPRHEFVPHSPPTPFGRDRRELSYEDYPLDIGFGQTISQPYIVAFMTEALKLEGGEKVLEIGTGSGYQAAVLAEMGVEVFTIEIIPGLAERARETLRRLGYERVHVRQGDGYRGWPEEAPFDAIIVTAAPPRVPPPLLEQLKVGGRLVIPVGSLIGGQDLERIVRTPEGFRKETLLPVRFVPMTGEAGGR